jgi:ribonuclease HII
VDDCKKVDPDERARLAPLIKQAAISWSVAFVQPEEIDRINIYHAGLLAMRRAIEGLRIVPEHVLIDGRKLPDVPLPQTRIFQGDAKSFCIAAASILAKTARDALMLDLDARYPGYGFARHKGYPVPEHLKILARRGPCEIHRRSFTPVKEAMARP